MFSALCVLFWVNLWFVCSVHCVCVRVRAWESNRDSIRAAVLATWDINVHLLTEYLHIGLPVVIGGKQINVFYILVSEVYCNFASIVCCISVFIELIGTFPSAHLIIFNLWAFNGLTFGLCVQYMCVCAHVCVHACVCVHVCMHEKATETPSMQPSCVFHCHFTPVLKGVAGVVDEIA